MDPYEEYQNTLFGYKRTFAYSVTTKVRDDFFFFFLVRPINKTSIKTNFRFHLEYYTHKSGHPKWSILVLTWSVADI